MATYTYGMRLRGFSPGCQPNGGLIERKDDPSGKYWDLLVYSRELTDEEVRSYELDRLRTAKEILAEYRDACEEIAEQCVEEGYPSHGSNYDLRCEQLWNEYYAAEYEAAEE